MRHLEKDHKCFKNPFSCCEKILYPNEQAAKAAEQRLRSRVLLSTMDIYDCKVHSGYHTGHDQFMSEKEILHRDLLHYKSMLHYNDKHQQT